MGEIVLIRHGQASFGADDYDKLSALGQQQGAILGHWLQAHHEQFSHVCLGELLRHRETTAACMTAMGDTAIPEADWMTFNGLNEYDHEDLIDVMRPDLKDPQNWTALEQRYGNHRRAFQAVFVDAFQRWTSGRHDSEYKDPWPQFKSRCLQALEQCLEAGGQGAKVGVFTSGGVISVICAQLLGMPDSKVGELNSAMVNSGMTRLLYQPGKVSLNSMNGYPHLYGPELSSLRSYR